MFGNNFFSLALEQVIAKITKWCYSETCQKRQISSREKTFSKTIYIAFNPAVPTRKSSPQLCFVNSRKDTSWTLFWSKAGSHFDAYSVHWSLNWRPGQKRQSYLAWFHFKNSPSSSVIWYNFRHVKSSAFPIVLGDFSSSSYAILDIFQSLTSEER